MRNMMMVGVVGLVLGLPCAATAQNLEMGKPTDSVVVLPFLSTGCPNFNPGQIVNSRIEGDGSIVPFNVPAGTAFMLTSVQFTSTGLLTGQRAGFVLRTVDSGIVIAEGYAVNTGDTGGGVTGTVVLSPPMRVTSDLCLDRGVGDPATTRNWIRGFLTRDR